MARKRDFDSWFIQKYGPPREYPGRFVSDMEHAYEEGYRQCDDDRMAEADDFAHQLEEE